MNTHQSRMHLTPIYCIAFVLPMLSACSVHIVEADGTRHEWHPKSQKERELLEARKKRRDELEAHATELLRERLANIRPQPKWGDGSRVESPAAGNVSGFRLAGSNTTRQRNTRELCQNLAQGNYAVAESLIAKGDFDLYVDKPGKDELKGVFNSLTYRPRRISDAHKFYKAPVSTVRALIEACLRMEPNPNVWFRTKEQKGDLLYFLRFCHVSATAHRDTISLLVDRGLDFDLSPDSFLHIYGYSVGEGASRFDQGERYVTGFAPLVARIAKAKGGKIDDFTRGFKEGYDREEHFDKPMGNMLTGFVSAVGLGVVAGGSKVAKEMAGKVGDAWERAGSAMNKSQTSSQANEGSSENPDVKRFRAQWQGKRATFEVVESGGAGLLSSGDQRLIVRDPGSGKRFQVGYDIGIGKDIFDSRAVGQNVEIRFNTQGTPSSIYCPGTGRSTGVNNDWKAAGFGW